MTQLLQRLTVSMATQLFCLIRAIRRKQVVVLAIVVLCSLVLRGSEFSNTRSPQAWNSLDSYLRDYTTDSSDKHGSFLTQDQRQVLPRWVQDYFIWHKAMRKRFPGTSIFRDHRAPTVLVFTAYSGITDRLRGLPFILYLANQTQRMLFIQWTHPAAIEEFLVPTEALDWSLPNGKNLLKRLSIYLLPNILPGIASMYGSHDSDVCDQFWERVDEMILAHKHNSHDHRHNARLARRRMLYVQQYVFPDNPCFVHRMRQAGDSNPIRDSYGVLFRALFQPSPLVKAYIDQVRADLQLIEGHYSAVHCRSRFPTNSTEAIRSATGVDPDMSGLVFQGAARQMAVGIATHALECARNRFYNNHTHRGSDSYSQTEQEPVYFFSDSSELSHFMANTIASSHEALLQDPVDQRAHKIVSDLNHHHHKIVARSDVLTAETLHLGRQFLFHAPHDYFPSFADLYIAMGARCVANGAGGFGRFAVELAITNCHVQHRDITGPIQCSSPDGYSS